MPRDWLAARRTEVAADRILDAAGELFTEKEAAAVGMHEIASAAGCSRATLYRYFENRDALYTAYVHRESYRLYREMTEQINSVVEPSERLIEGMLASLRNVRESPALASWFATTQRPIGAEMAEQSEVINALTEAFVISLGPDEPESGRTPCPLARSGDDVTVPVPRAQRRGRAVDARGVRRPDRAAEPAGANGVARPRLLACHRDAEAFVGVDVVVGILGVLAQIDSHPVDLAVEPAGVGGVVGADGGARFIADVRRLVG